MSEEKTEVIDVTGEVKQVDDIQRSLKLIAPEHEILQKNLIRIISAVNSGSGFSKTLEQIHAGTTNSIQ